MRTRGGRGGWAWVLAAVVPLLVGAIAQAQSARPFTDAERLALDRGELVVRPEAMEQRGFRLVGGSSWMVANATPDATWRAALDYRRWPRFIPRLSEIRVARSGRAPLLVLHHVFGPADVTYTLRVRLRGSERDMSFALDPTRPHGVRAAWGFFRISPHGRGRALVSYGAMVDVGTGVVRTLFEGMVHRWLLRVPRELARWVESPEGRRRYGRVNEGAARWLSERRGTALQ